MDQFLVVEIQTMPDGAIGNLAFAYSDRNEAESKMHALLSTAAVSTLPRHSVVLLDNAGSRLAGGCYVHGGEPEE